MKEIKLKPFDLQAALEGKPVVTRDGRPVKIAGYYDKTEDKFSVTGWLNYIPLYWDSKGKYTGHVKEHPSDLFMATEKREEWVCYWEKDGKRSYSMGISKQSAELFAQASKGIIINTIKIWEEEI